MKLISPRILILLSFIIWLLVYVVSPIQYITKPTNQALLYLFFCFASFFIGTFYTHLFFITKKNQVKFKPKKEEYKNLKFLRIVSFIGLIGLIFRYYDLLFVKDFISYGSVTAFRLHGSIINDTTFVGIGSSILYPFSIIAIVVSFHINEKKIIDKVLIVLNILLFVIYIYLLGGRTSLTLIIIMVLISIIFKKKKLSHVFNLKRIVFIVMLFLLFFAYSNLILINRLEEMGFNIQDHLNYMQNERRFIVKDWFNNILSNDDVFTGGVKYTYISLVHYVLHGYYQFFLLFEHFNSSNLGYGAYQFYPVFKLGNFIGIEVVDYYELMSKLETQGVYTTFFGPLYADFGFGGLTFLFMFLFGFVSQLFYKKALNGELFSTLFYSYLGSVLIHSSFINMIQSGMGLYVFVSILFSALLLKLMS
ncbi:O-antigen polymerase [Bacillus kexueae]|uniref:O-antigen polymerase n=1 Tax=Aeribacillus kexueae TaxID=2078952 RepID=UPI001FAF5B4E|nr:O-antigen polymerase [Bacillus kexueae]